MKMDPTIKAELLRRLRSGDYKQGRRLLRSLDDTYCCLGLLCDIVDPKGWFSDGTTASGACFSHGVDTAFPGNFVLTACGMPVPDGKNNSTHPLWHYVNLNDGGATFLEIADDMEKNL